PPAHPRRPRFHRRQALDPVHGAVRGVRLAGSRVAGAGVRFRLPRIYAITDRAASGGEDPVAVAARLVSVGVRCIQVREKVLADGELLAEVDAVARIARAAGARILVNDRVDVARLAGVGVHLGEDALPAAAARAILPESI